MSAPAAREAQDGRTWPLRASAGGCSIMGGHNYNEDRLLLVDDGTFCAVADGMGGTGSGSVMAEVCCEVAWAAWRALRPVMGDTEASLSEAVRIADRAASDLAARAGDVGSGATMAVASFGGDRMSLASVGDCRAYLFRDGSLRHILDGGRRDSFSSVPDAACGWGISPMPRTASLEPEAGDVVVLCSDGVWATQPEYAMAKSLSVAEQCEGKVTATCLAHRLAYSSDQSDNATAIVTVFEEVTGNEGDSFQQHFYPSSPR
ncbi:MAG: PP2C family protein-serine/threonine phosphatase [Coriobacteriales bacterium]|nr:PP2C family protein-serine/threonine phosphatase [Coriobacteriales bacterium]